jgi:hypothetical protein
MPFATGAWVFGALGDQHSLKRPGKTVSSTWCEFGHNCHIARALRKGAGSRALEWGAWFNYERLLDAESASFAVG